MPLTDLFNAPIPEGLQNLAGNFQKSFPNSYDFAKTFVQTSKSSAGGGNGVTSLDDPTYLGFNLRFIINSPLFEGAIEGNPAIPANPIDSFQALSNTSNGVASTPAAQSAVGYLNKIGETTRATYLTAFCQGIKEIEYKRPYYFQTIEGLGEAYNKTVNMTPYGGSAEGEGITVGLLEAVDLKMSALFNLYKAACYDVKYRRHVLPKNLMYFDVEVDVLEIRKFRSIKSALNSFITKIAKNPNDPADDLNRFVNENASRLTFKFTDCVWDVSASGAVFANVTNVQGQETMAASSMKWSFGNVVIASQFAGYDSSLSDTANLQPKTFKDLAKAVGTKLLDKVKQGAENFVQRKGLSFIQGLKFGNVYGLGNSIINNIKNPQGLLSALQGALVQEATTPGFVNSIGANIYEGEIAAGGSTQTLESRRILPEGDEADPLQTSNIFGTQPSGPALQSSNLFEGDIPPGGSTQEIQSSNLFEGDIAAGGSTQEIQSSNLFEGDIPPGGSTQEIQSSNLFEGDIPPDRSIQERERITNLFEGDIPADRSTQERERIDNLFEGDIPPDRSIQERERIDNLFED